MTNQMVDIRHFTHPGHAEEMKDPGSIGGSDESNIQATQMLNDDDGDLSGVNTTYHQKCQAAHDLF